jgi:hypothetical protein
VLIDPNFIPYHKGFTGDMDWFDKDIAEIKKYKETEDVNHKA